MSGTDIISLVKELGLFPAIAMVLVIYMTRTLSGKLDDVSTELRSERTTRERNSENITRELVTQTILLNQMAGGRSGMRDIAQPSASAPVTNVNVNPAPPKTGGAKEGTQNAS